LLIAGTGGGRTTSAQRRFEKIVEESPAFDTLQDRHGRKLGTFLKKKVEVVEGDVSVPGLGLNEATQSAAAKSLDLVVNSAGLTDFNPDLRDAISSNVDSAIYLLDFSAQMPARRVDAPFHVLRCRDARRPGQRATAGKLQSCWRFQI